MEHNANNIMKGLWLGNKKAAKNIDFLNTNNITYIINVSDHIDNYFEYDKKFKYLRVPINNKVSNIRILRENLDDIYDFIDSARKNQDNVLVHCKKGHRRSALIVAYYIMKTCNCSFEMAKIKIQSKRTGTLREPLILKDAILNK